MPHVVALRLHIEKSGPRDAMMHRQKLEWSKVQQQTFGRFIRMASCQHNAAPVEDFHGPVQVPAAKCKGS
jgi:hypothetical protein